MIVVIVIVVGVMFGLSVVVIVILFVFVMAVEFVCYDNVVMYFDSEVGEVVVVWKNGVIVY